MQDWLEEVSGEAEWAIFPSQKKPWRALYYACTPAGRAEVLKQRNERVHGARPYPEARQKSPRDRDNPLRASSVRI